MANVANTPRLPRAEHPYNY